MPMFDRRPDDAEQFVSKAIYTNSTKKKCEERESENENNSTWDSMKITGIFPERSFVLFEQTSRHKDSA